jgi:hypothetical protein
VCDGRFFFSKVKLSQDLIPGVGWKDQPTSLLNSILGKVMFAEPILRPTYPTEWEYVEVPPATRQNEQREARAEADRINMSNINRANTNKGDKDKAEELRNN